eukprot:TRINITY_DN7777_c0_g1_i1.p1 TRINITY_DN7777_c0_g1~~TRINITY_DN7777_c0_g1_i1.p1  ORF type:complete len:181 (-),score=36.94 TRINITY_DN7777_c0_g1_i1:68-568(-)
MDSQTKNIVFAAVTTAIVGVCLYLYVSKTQTPSQRRDVNDVADSNNYNNNNPVGHTPIPLPSPPPQFSEQSLESYTQLIQSVEEEVAKMHLTPKQLEIKATYLKKLQFVTTQEEHERLHQEMLEKANLTEVQMEAIHKEMQKRFDQLVEEGRIPHFLFGGLDQANI